MPGSDPWYGSVLFADKVKREPGLEVVDVLDRWKTKGLLQAFVEVVAEALHP